MGLGIVVMASLGEKRTVMVCPNCGVQGATVGEIAAQYAPPPPRKEIRPVTLAAIMGLAVVFIFGTLWYANRDTNTVQPTPEENEHVRLAADLQKDKPNILAAATTLLSQQNYKAAGDLLGIYSSLSDPDVDKLSKRVELGAARKEVKEHPPDTHARRLELLTKTVELDPVDNEARAQRDKEARLVNQVAASSGSGKSRTAGKGFPSVTPEAVAQKYGMSDVTESTEYDNPRPPIVTKFLVYTDEHVRFVLVPDAPMGARPPYRQWKLIAAQDPRDNSVLSADEATKRMAGRVRR